MNKTILTWSERVTPGVPAKAINMALLKENEELRKQIKELESFIDRKSPYTQYTPSRFI